VTHSYLDNIIFKPSKLKLVLASSESDDEDQEEVGNKEVENTEVGNKEKENNEVGNNEVGNKDVGNKDVGNNEVGNGETLQSNEEAKSNEKVDEIMKDQENPNPDQSEERTKSVENEASIHSQLEMSDESESELCIDAGDVTIQSTLSPKKTLTSPKKSVTSSTNEHNESLDLNDYWKKGLKKDKNWKDQNCFESLVDEITNKRSKPAFARVVALGRIELGLHDDVSKIISADMLKFILKCHNENQFNAVEAKIQQLIKGMSHFCIT